MAVDKIAHGKQVVIIDGVGFPAVGSICGTDNASVARASGYPILASGAGAGAGAAATSSTTTTTTGNTDNDGRGPTTPTQQQEQQSEQQATRQPPGVVLVGGSGVGGAVDAYHLNATYFEQAQVPVLGAIFNKLSTKPDDFYSLDKCRQQITLYFDTNPHQQSLGRRPFGFVPLHAGIATSDHDQAMQQVYDYIHVDIAALIDAAAKIHPSNNSKNAFEETTSSPSPPLDEMMDVDVEMQDVVPSSSSAVVAGEQEGIDNGDRPVKRLKASEKIRARTREEIEREAILSGAAPSAWSRRK